MYVNKLFFLRIIIIMLLNWKDQPIEFPDTQKNKKKFTQCIVNAQTENFLYILVKLMSNFHYVNHVSC